MTICILGRQPLLGLAELKALYGDSAVTLLAPTVAQVNTDTVDGTRLGGVLKVATLLDTFDTSDWRKASQQVVKALSIETNDKITLGISAYHFPVSAREVQKTGLVFKRTMKEKKRVNIRLVPNPEPALNTAQVLHNKLTRAGKREIMIIKGDDGKSYVAETSYVQNIEAYTVRDRGRPKRDAFVGMLPPKLAQTMINLACFPLAASGPEKDSEPELRLLDPFCGTGVVLQEAALMGFAVYGTDLSERMIRYTRDNLVWLSDTHHVIFDKYFQQADAMDAIWQQPVDVVVGEGYLGRPLSTTPDKEALESIVHECNGIMKAFLKNISAQLKPGTPLCIAAPAWHIRGDVRHLSVIDDLESLGFTRHKFDGISHSDLIYARTDQIVGRELLVLSKQ